MHQSWKEKRELEAEVSKLISERDAQHKKIQQLEVDKSKIQS